MLPQAATIRIPVAHVFEAQQHSWPAAIGEAASKATSAAKADPGRIWPSNSTL